MPTVREHNWEIPAVSITSGSASLRMPGEHKPTSDYVVMT